MPLKAVRNVQAGGYGADGVFHPFRSSVDYDPDLAGDDYGARTDATGFKRRRSKVTPIRKASRRTKAKGKRRNPAPPGSSLKWGWGSGGSYTAKASNGDYKIQVVGVGTGRFGKSRTKYEIDFKPSVPGLNNAYDEARTLDSAIAKARAHYHRWYMAQKKNPSSFGPRRRNSVTVTWSARRKRATMLRPPKGKESPRVRAALAKYVRASGRRNPDPDFLTERVGGDAYLMRQWGQWYPMRKTPQGNLAFLNGPGDKHDGTKASALRIVGRYLANKRKGNPRSAKGPTFKSLPIGAKFRFASEEEMPFSGMARGPWIKTSARGYTHADSGGKYKVGSASTRVKANPGRRRRNAGPYSVRKARKTLKKSGHGFIPRRDIKTFREVYGPYPKRGLSHRKRNASTLVQTPGTKLYSIHIPATYYDAGYNLTIRAKSKRTARAEAKAYCADSYHRITGRPKNSYKLPSHTVVKEVSR